MAMAKRVGPNHRKKSAKRNRRLASSFFTMAIFCLAIALVLGAFVLLYWNYEPRIMGIVERIKVSRNPSINHVVVKGTLQVLPDELLRKAGITLPLSFDTLKKECLARLKTVHPWIEQVRCVGHRGGTVTLEVRERRPIAFLQSATITLVDDQGVRMPLERGVTYDVPLVSGIKDSAGGLTADGLVRLTRFLAESVRYDPAFAAAVTQLHFECDGRVAVVLEGVPTVVVMRDNAVREGIDRLTMLWTMVGNGSYPQRIDISYSTLAFVTLHGAARIAGAGDPMTPGKKG
jgi:cell division septal protein FtsQ